MHCIYEMSAAPPQEQAGLAGCLFTPVVWLCLFCRELFIRRNRLTCKICCFVTWLGCWQHQTVVLHTVGLRAFRAVMGGRWGINKDPAQPLLCREGHYYLGGKNSRTCAGVCKRTGLCCYLLHASTAAHRLFTWGLSRPNCAVCLPLPQCSIITFLPHADNVGQPIHDPTCNEHSLIPTAYGLALGCLTATGCRWATVWHGGASSAQQ